MRQLFVQVPRGRGSAVLDIAAEHQGANLAAIEGSGPDGPVDIAIVHVSNTRVEGLLDALQALPDLRVTLIPRGVITLHPPPSEAPQQVTDVTHRSPVEIYLAGLQSVGSWRAFLGYAAAAGIVVWVGLYTNTVYLLTAAMLIAPFAGPAMDVALAAARGDVSLLARGLTRYIAGLIVAIMTAGAISLALGQGDVTAQMVATANVSVVAVLLPIVAGAAGALTLVQAERNSLVSGAAVGVLVAASLVPPAGLVGMAGALGRWDMALDGLFVIALQLVGITFSGALVFRLYGLSPHGVRYSDGRAGVFPAALVVTAVAVGGLLFWQHARPPTLQQSSRAQRASAQIAQVVNSSGVATLVEADVRFPRSTGQDTLLGVVYVLRRAGSPPAARLRVRLAATIQVRLRGDSRAIVPLIDVVVLQAPRGDGP